MDIEELDERFEYTFQKIDDLYEFIGPESQRQDLIEEIQDLIRELQDEIKILDSEWDPVFSGNFEGVDIDVKEYILEKNSELKRSRKGFREAILQNKVNRARKFNSEREALLSGSITPSEYRKNKARSENKVLDAAQDATQALRETAQLMNRELEVSVSNVTALEESSRLLVKNKEQHENINFLLSMTKRLLTELERADWVDRVLMALAFIFFSIVALNIIRKRIWIPFLPSFLNYKSQNAKITQTIFITPTSTPLNTESNTIQAIPTITSVILASISPIAMLSSFSGSSKKIYPDKDAFVDKNSHSSNSVENLFQETSQDYIAGESGLYHSTGLLLDGSGSLAQSLSNIPGSNHNHKKQKTDVDSSFILNTSGHVTKTLKVTDDRNNQVFDKSLASELSHLDNDSGINLSKHDKVEL
ncbi:hypothetical protein AYI68_g6130 [Smittium mucronatum]|uniref:Sec20 C-terminal domain-containing protein n=1 Tax=Smittium mucronatum TaxID=133383 RepID=A0A1R0GSB5_9FUNG|nr:hypothetical protein AYI68_g6130 [Smittium mucronatum]